MRFKRSASQLIGSRLFTRRELNSRLAIHEAVDRGEFLGKLWGLFGKPSPRSGGFEYFLHDTRTDLDFIAYVGPHGPCYGGDLALRSPLRPVLEAFEAIIEHSRAIPCAIDYAAERDIGREIWVLGYRDGKSFDVPDRRNRRGEARIERRQARVR
jgi:hypothetical protein